MKVSAKTIAMINALSRKYGDYIFNPDPNSTLIRKHFKRLSDVPETDLHRLFKTQGRNRFTFILFGISKEQRNITEPGTHYTSRTSLAQTNRKHRNLHTSDRV